jgi:hypothetical protein
VLHRRHHRSMKKFQNPKRLAPFLRERKIAHSIIINRERSSLLSTITALSSKFSKHLIQVLRTLTYFLTNEIRQRRVLSLEIFVNIKRFCLFLKRAPPPARKQNFIFSNRNMPILHFQSLNAFCS